MIDVTNHDADGLKVGMLNTISGCALLSKTTQNIGRENTLQQLLLLSPKIHNLEHQRFPPMLFDEHEWSYFYHSFAWSLVVIVIRIYMASYPALSSLTVLHLSEFTHSYTRGVRFWPPILALLHYICALWLHPFATNQPPVMILDVFFRRFVVGIQHRN